jgi:predicted aconitase
MTTTKTIRERLDLGRIEAEIEADVDLDASVDVAPDLLCLGQPRVSAEEAARLLDLRVAREAAHARWTKTRRDALDRRASAKTTAQKQAECDAAAEVARKAFVAVLIAQGVPAK